jgi:hypothetical protein
LVPLLKRSGLSIKNGILGVGGVLVLFLKRSGLSIKNGILLYKQVIRPVMDYACPIWSFAESTLVRRVQVLLSKCFRLAFGALWYKGSRQIHEDLGVPFFAEHIRALTRSFGSRSTNVGTPWFGN